MDITTHSIYASVEGTLQALTALAVAYSFSVIGAILILIVGWMAAGLAERWAYAGLKRFRGFEETLRKFLSKVLRYAILVFVGVTVLAQFGVQTASLIAALGAAGLAVGLALQGTLQNIAAGLMLLFLRPFRVGEFIEAGGISGTIEEIGLFATELKAGDGVYVLAPNSQLWNTPVTNFSRNPRRSNTVSLRIGYEGEVDRALATLGQLAAADRRVLCEPAPSAYISELGENAVVVTMFYWTSTADHWRTKLDLTRAAKRAFDEKGIVIALPRQEVRLSRPARTHRGMADQHQKD